MFATATLTAHRGATLVTRDALAQYEPPEPEGRWKPVKHSLIVDLMHEELARREIQITEEGDPPDHWRVPDVVINNSQDFEAYTSGGQTP